MFYSFTYLTNVTASTSDCNTTSESYNNISYTANKSVPVLHNNDKKMCKTSN